MAANDDPSLLDDAAFLAELERFDGGPARHDSTSRPPIAGSAVLRDHRDAIDGAFALDHAGSERPRPTLLDAEHHRHSHAHAATRRRAPRMAVVLVLVMGFVAGAGAAAVTFHGRVQRSSRR